MKVCSCKRRNQEEGKERNIIIPFLKEVLNILEAQKSNPLITAKDLSNILCDFTYNYCKIDNQLTAEQLRKYIEIVEKILEV